MLYLIIVQAKETIYYGPIFIFIPYLLFLLTKLIFSLIKDEISLKNEIQSDIVGLVFFIPFTFINLMPQGATLYTYLILMPLIISIFSLWYYAYYKRLNIFMLLYPLATGLLIALYINAYRNSYVLTYTLYVLLMITILTLAIFEVQRSKEKPLVYIINIALVEGLYLLKFFLSRGGLDSSSFRSIIIAGGIIATLVLALLAKEKPLGYLKSFIVVFIILNLLDSFIKKGIYFFTGSNALINYMMIFMSSLILIYFALMKLIDSKKPQENSLHHFSALGLIILLVGLLSSLRVGKYAVSFINNSGVEITSLGEEKLLSVGYTPDEINNITNEEYENILSMNILSTTKEVRLLSDSSVTTSKEAVVEDDYKRLTINVTYYSNEGKTGRFFVKETLEYLKSPHNRGNDYLGIYTGETFILPLDEEALDFNLKLSYSYQQKVSYLNSRRDNVAINKNILESYDSSNIKYKSDGYNLLASINLPNDSYYDYSDELEGKIIENTYSNFVISLSATFIPLYPNPLEGRFRATHLHERNVPLNSDSISLKGSDPYFSLALPINPKKAIDYMSTKVALDLYSGK